MSAECRRDAGEGVEAGAGAATFFEAGDDRLRGAHALGEFALCKASLAAEVVDELAEGEILFDGGARRWGSGSPCLFDVVPAGVIRHCHVSYGLRRAHSAAAMRARSICVRLTEIEDIARMRLSQLGYVQSTQTKPLQTPSGALEAIRMMRKYPLNRYYVELEGIEPSKRRFSFGLVIVDLGWSGSLFGVPGGADRLRPCRPDISC